MGAFVFRMDARGGWRARRWEAARREPRAVAGIIGILDGEIETRAVSTTPEKQTTHLRGAPA